MFGGYSIIKDFEGSASGIKQPFGYFFTEIEKDVGVLIRFEPSTQTVQI
jgi:hypothetical protein